MGSNQCVAVVIGGSSLRKPRCSVTARHEHDGKRYCHIHYPPNVERRDAEKRARRDVKSKEQIARWNADSKRRLAKANPALVAEVAELKVTIALLRRDINDMSRAVGTTFYRCKCGRMAELDIDCPGCNK